MIPVLMEMLGPAHGRLRSCYVWLPPVLAFAGLGLLLVFGGEHWLYRLPSFQTPLANTQLLWGRSDALQGAVEVPTVVQSGTVLALTGWLEGTQRLVQPQQIIVSVDDKVVAESRAFQPNPKSPDGRSFTWRLDFALKEERPGEHQISVQVIPEQHDSMIVAKSTIVVVQ